MPCLVRVVNEVVYRILGEFESPLHAIYTTLRKFRGANALPVRHIHERLIEEGICFWIAFIAEVSTVAIGLAERHTARVLVGVCKPLVEGRVSFFDQVVTQLLIGVCEQS